MSNQLLLCCISQSCVLASGVYVTVHCAIWLLAKVKTLCFAKTAQFLQGVLRLVARSVFLSLPLLFWHAFQRFPDLVDLQTGRNNMYDVFFGLTIACHLASLVLFWQTKHARVRSLVMSMLLYVLVTMIGFYSYSLFASGRIAARLMAVSVDTGFGPFILGWFIHSASLAVWIVTVLFGGLWIGAKKPQLHKGIKTSQNKEPAERPHPMTLRVRGRARSKSRSKSRKSKGK